MNALLPRFLKVAYRKEPISSFVVIVGSVDAVIGGVGESSSLLSFGVIMVILAIILRWWQSQRKESQLAEQPVTRFLPPTSSRPPLPSIPTKQQRQPPR